LEDETREFVTCENVRLELLPKPALEKRRSEAEFYNAHFAAFTLNFSRFRLFRIRASSAGLPIKN
jgi:hypothetical protein